MMSEKKSIQCVSCGHSELRRVKNYIIGTDFFKHVLNDRRIYECPHCGLCQVDHDTVNMPNLFQYYQDFYRMTDPLDPNQPHNKFTVRAWIFRDLIKKYLGYSPRKIFEPGCGFGHSLIYFKKAFPGCEVFTDEKDRKSMIGNVGTFDLEAERSGAFDVILMSHLLEHIVHPKAYIEKIIHHLTPGGILVLEVPNENKRVIMKRFILEPHVTFFNKKAFLEFFSLFKDQLDIETCFTAKGTDVRFRDDNWAVPVKFYIKKGLLNISRLAPSFKERILKSYRKTKSRKIVNQSLKLSLMKERYRLFSPPVPEEDAWSIRMVLRKKT